ncbi:MAG TPA: glucokinase, partial [Albitalea sp.]|nr:glucokinase [Albitalea sp.]
PRSLAPLRMDSIRSYQVAQFASLQEVAANYLLDAQAAPLHAVIAVAGRIADGQVQLTNHSWRIVEREVREQLALKSVKLVNDFAAVSMALPLLAADELAPLVVGNANLADRPETQTYCVLGPGTGLGIAALRLQQGHVVVLQTEGGHSSFAPGDPVEIEVLKQLTRRFGRVSNERLICGSGLVNIYQALGEINHVRTEALTPQDVTQRAKAHTDRLCEQAVDLFCAILGSIAGDLVLTYGAWDGAFLAGAWLAPLLPTLRGGAFRRRFAEKGRFTQFMQGVPVSLVIHPQPGLLGAAGYAVSEAGLALPRPQNHASPEAAMRPSAGDAAAWAAAHVPAPHAWNRAP